MNWLAKTLARCQLTEPVEGYLLGRGAKEESYQKLRVVTWQRPAEPIQDPSFRDKYRPYGDMLEGRLICPLYSPRGQVIGFEGRAIDRKALTEFLLPEAAWNPVFLGLCPETMAKIWAGGDVWIGEGLFDMFPLEWVVPYTDVVLSTLRARLADRHVDFLRRFCRGWVHLVYDRDTMGRKATVGWTDETGKRRWGALDKLNRVGVKCRDVPYVGGKDPGEVWDHGGVAAMRAAFHL